VTGETSAQEELLDEIKLALKPQDTSKQLFLYKMKILN
jgi:hypothetical protein